MFLLATTHATVQENKDTHSGGWRSVNLQLSPFNFPPPVELITEDPELGKHLGMFAVDKEKKLLHTFDKSGCCWHITEEFSVVNNAPKKVSEVVEDATINDQTKVKIITKKLVNGKWQTKVKMVARKE